VGIAILNPKENFRMNIFSQTIFAITTLLLAGYLLYVAVFALTDIVGYLG
jgi:hypothetical protein